MIRADGDEKESRAGISVDGRPFEPRRPGPAAHADPPSSWRGIRHRLAPKLILWLTGIVVLVQGISALITLHVHERRLLDEIIQSADQLSGTITHSTWQAMQIDRRDDAYQMMRNIARQPGIAKIRIFNKEGRVMFSTDPEAGRMVDKSAEACDLCHAASEPLVRVDVPSRTRIFRHASGDRVLGLITPIYNEPACSRADCHAHPEEIHVLGVLDVDMSLRRVDQAMAHARFWALGVTLLTIVLSGGFIAVFVRRFVGRPIGRLIEATQAVSQMELDRSIEPAGQDEVGELSLAFDLMRRRLRHALDELNALTEQLERKVAERTVQLQEAQDGLIRQDRLASLGRLSASMAHEINNPIAGVHNLIMLLERILASDGLTAERQAEVRSYLAQAEQETARVGRIVSDLLTFARQARPRRAAVDLNATVRDTLALVSARIARSGVTLRVETDPGLEPVWCDRAQIMQVVMNLVTNAAEAMPGGGAVAVRTRRGAAGTTAMLEVEDTGSGISAEAMGRIFDPFYTTKEDGKGVGLGLAVVYGIIRAHDGMVDVHSAPGIGTVFQVTLPVEESRKPAMPGTAAWKEGGKDEA